MCLLFLPAVAQAAEAPAPPATTSPPPPPPPAAPAQPAPFAWGDFTWMNGQSRQKTFPLDFSKYVTLSLYLDTYYAYSLNRPRDNTLTATASVARHNEIQINLASVGFEWNYKNVIGRLSLQFGNMLNVVQDLDGSTARGRSLTSQNMRYMREATLGYHFDVHSGLNLEAGMFMSYIGLESYLLAENWNYSRSMACEATPFYFHGVRAQYFPTPKIKIEPWLMNGWQSYGKWNFAPSSGLAFRWNPNENVGFMANFYVGTDTRGVDDRVRFHHDDSVLVKYYDRPESSFISKLAVSINNHVGFESGGVGQPSPSRAHVLATSIAHRVSMMRDHFFFTIRGEYFSNPSRYLASYAPPGFSQVPGDSLQAYGGTATLEYMPIDFLGIRAEVVHRRSNVPYFAGPGGTTSNDGYQDGPTDGFTIDTRKHQTLALVSANFRM